ncbi:hypothetical protein ASC97_03135 [Rhizobium sp. Root1203]|uniref:hypothetical protein n=1 Tax=Rhizobium sp. Root1203 TaxID=1736427 RepID=UPI000715A7F5|nr:hypothetical protein [Rhizobium sp. Root1203]KQV32577.1 hypothetical protein ASC97_03135 [Rhizobium sp. Root1203]
MAASGRKTTTASPAERPTADMMGALKTLASYGLYGLGKVGRMQLARRWACGVLEVLAGIYWLSAAAWFSAQFMMQTAAPGLCSGEPIKVVCTGFTGAWALELILQTWIRLTFLPFFWWIPASGSIFFFLPALAYWFALALGSVLGVRRLFFSA